MNDFVKIDPMSLDGNVFHLIGEEWMLITAEHEGKVNTMTASWGGLGFLWRRPVAFVFIRPQRFTFTLTEKTDRLTLSFLPEEYRDALRVCGSKSGRDIDKFAETGLTGSSLPSGGFAVDQARLVFDCRRLYASPLEECAFLDKSILENYREGDYHMMYVCEISAAYKK